MLKLKSYTAFNRTFSLYSEAVQYCDSSDFDYSLIQTNVQYESAHNHVIIKTITGETFSDVRIHPADNDNHKVCYSSDDYFFIHNDDILSVEYQHRKSVTEKVAAHTELIYTLETTALQVDVKLDYSNIKGYQFNNLDDCLKRFNLYQQHGYNNLQIMTSVKYKNEPIIEDTTSCLELSVSAIKVEKQNEDSKRLMELEQQVNLYKSFISKYKSEKLFSDFIKSESNKPQPDSDNNYWYEFRLRGFSLGCQPHGHKEVNNEIGRYGIIAYDRPLTQSELNDYELSPYKTA